MIKLFKKGDYVRLIYDHSYVGTVTNTKHIISKDFHGPYQWLYIDGFISGFSSNKFELIKETTDREKAIRWWKSLGFEIGEIADKYYKGCETITGREIEEIWRKEIIDKYIPDYK